LVAVLSKDALAAGFPAGMATSTAAAAVLFEGGRAVAVSAISPGVRSLAEGFLKALLVARLKWAGGAVGVLALLAVFFVFLFPKPLAKQAKAGVPRPPDWERFQGTWRFLELEMRGEKQVAENALWIFHDDECDLVFADGITLRMSFKLDQTTEHKWIDLEFVLQQQKMIDRGIYELEGDSLKICYSVNAARPTEFVSHKGTPETFCVLQRDKATSDSQPGDLPK
jgi:uncharacterized protein (TIGR03067 family)